MSTLCAPWQHLGELVLRDTCLLKIFSVSDPLKQKGNLNSLCQSPKAVQHTFPPQCRRPLSAVPRGTNFHPLPPSETVGIVPMPQTRLPHATYGMEMNLQSIRSYSQIYKILQVPLAKTQAVS